MYQVIPGKGLNKWLLWRIASLRGARPFAYLYVIWLRSCAPCALHCIRLAYLFRSFLEDRSRRKVPNLPFGLSCEPVEQSKANITTSKVGRISLCHPSYV
ncbi:hypothetical protein [Nitrosomonas sp. Nm33]|uniref:hypothetical protein n=1 Tax=Nitrosomonas sp. Nm33 TaxID=133724 RepID=UPI00115F8FFD|nr:hypothetical protein [Nitrosomonas sp. Nm33]